MFTKNNGWTQSVGNWEARRFAAMEREMAKAAPHEGPKKEYLITLGQKLWEMSYKHDKDDTRAFELLLRGLMELQLRAAQVDTYAMDLNAAAMVPSQQILMIGSALWCDQGYPQITMGHKYAASLLSTRVSQDVLQFAKPPWRSFYIEVPSDLIFIHHDTLNQDVSVKGILVYQIAPKEGGMKWHYTALTGTTAQLWMHGLSTEQLVSKERLISGGYEQAAFSEEFTSLDERAIFLIGRLVVNTCLAMSNPEQVTPPREEKKSKNKHHKREHADPKVRTYILGKDKTPLHDCRSAVRNFQYATKVRAELAVQFMVSGHWKPKLAERVGHPVWVEPYWKGPDEAPIAVNQHVLKGPK